MRLGFQVATLLLLPAIPASAAQLTPAARRAFDEYTATVEKRLVQQHSNSDSYLAALNLTPAERAEAERQLKSGTLLMDPVNGGTREVSGGLLHHWRGTAFVPGATAKDMLALLRDYNHLAVYYAPEVESSRVLADQGTTATIAMRMRKQKVVTIILDSEYDIQTGLSGSGGYSVSRSAHIWEVEGAGTPHEHRLPEGNDDGFLWRLNSYWSFVEQPDGLFIECEAVSLTRDVPGGLAWMVMPILQEMPRESLRFTLTATRNALESGVRKGGR